MLNNLQQMHLKLIQKKFTKIVEASGHLIGNKNADRVAKSHNKKITSTASRSNPEIDLQISSKLIEITKIQEDVYTYISTKRQGFIDELRLI